MKSIPVDVDQLVFIAMGDPRPKLRNRQTGEVATDKQGRPTYVVPVAALRADDEEEGDGSLIKIQVSGEPVGIRRGLPIQVESLMARSWEIRDEKTGEPRFGISYWARSLAPVKAPSSAAA
jgi:hypothetical protein